MGGFFWFLVLLLSLVGFWVCNGVRGVVVAVVGCFVAGFWFGSLLVVDGSFGGDLLLNFLIFSITLSWVGLWCGLVGLVGW